MCLPFSLSFFYLAGCVADERAVCSLSESLLLSAAHLTADDRNKERNRERKEEAFWSVCVCVCVLHACMCVCVHVSVKLLKSSVSDDSIVAFVGKRKTKIMGCSSLSLSAGWSSSHLTCRLTDQPGQVPSLHSSNPGG